MQTGVHCTLKHFPGLGRVYEDTHRVTAELSARVARARGSRTGCRSGTSWRRATLSRCSSHARLTAVDRDRPASFSDAVVKGLLRETWKHDGILVTDDFSMGAVTLEPRRRGGGAIAALNAGVDLILVSYDPDQYFPMMYALLAADARRAFTRRYARSERRAAAPGRVAA